MILRQLKMWGVKDGKRVAVYQFGPRLELDPEIPEIRAAEDVEAATRAYVDVVIDLWRRDWYSDEVLRERATAWNQNSEEVYTVESLRADDERRFDEWEEGPPYGWDSIKKCLGKQKELIKRSHDDEPPTEVLLCRECLKECRWIWHECFPVVVMDGRTYGNCGSAGWTAICEDCKTWHREETCVRA